MKDLLDLVNDITVKPYVTSTKKSYGLYPTSASVQYTENNKKVTIGSCLRSLWYQVNGYTFESTNTAESIDRMNIGEWFSNNLIERFKELGIYVASEVPFEEPICGVRGRIDILIKDPFKAPKSPQRPLPNHLIGIEVKSTGGYHLIKGPIISTRDTPLMPKLEHVLQVMLYLAYYREYGLDTWIIIYQDRESLRKQWHKVTLNDNGSPVITNEQQVVTLNNITINNIYERFNKLKEHVKVGTLPERDYELQYSNKHLLDLYNDKNSDLNETDRKAIEKKLFKNKGKNILELDPLIVKGDNACKYCGYKELCWSENPLKKAAAPLVAPIEQPEAKVSENIDFI